MHCSKHAKYLDVEQNERMKSDYSSVKNVTNIRMKLLLQSFNLRFERIVFCLQLLERLHESNS